LVEMTTKAIATQPLGRDDKKGATEKRKML